MPVQHANAVVAIGAPPGLCHVDGDALQHAVVHSVQPHPAVGIQYGDLRLHKHGSHV